jgi:type III secretory pathway component EscR
MYLFLKNKRVLSISIFLACLLLGICFSKVYQPQARTIRIYKQALKDYNNENYSNAYYLFSKIGYSSSLKPIALYRQSICAKSLGDKISELKSYKLLISHYPKNKLTPEAQYLAGQILIENNPHSASKYFNSVIKSDLDEDYIVAAKYYKARIAASKLRYSKQNIFSKKENKKIEQAFREYLEKYPDGRLSLNVVNTWKKFNPNLSEKDVALILRAYYLSGKYKEVENYSQNSKIDYDWAILAANAYALNDFVKTKNLTEEGVEKYYKTVEKKDYNRAVDKYLSIFPDEKQEQYISDLLLKSKGDKKDYIWNLKCEKVSINILAIVICTKIFLIVNTQKMRYFKCLNMV